MFLISIFHAQKKQCQASLLPHPVQHQIVHLQVLAGTLAPVLAHPHVPDLPSSHHLIAVNLCTTVTVEGRPILSHIQRTVTS